MERPAPKPVAVEPCTRLNQREVAEQLAAIDDAEALAEAIQARRDGELLPESWPMVRASREERSQERRHSATRADVVSTYDPVNGSYRETDVLRPGQGDWASAAHGGTLVFTPIAP